MHREHRPIVPPFYKLIPKPVKECKKIQSPPWGIETHRSPFWQRDEEIWVEYESTKFEPIVKFKH